MAHRTPPETPETSPHDYEPGQFYHGGYSDPLCRVCGQPKPAKVHQ